MRPPLPGLRDILRPILLLHWSESAQDGLDDRCVASKPIV